MNRPFIARRARRCALAPHCPQGGRIRPGEEVYRSGHRTYVHVDDIPMVLTTVATVMDALTAAVVPMAEAWAQFATDVLAWGRRVAAPILIDQARDAAAHLITRLGDYRLAIRPDPDHPGAVLIVPETSGPWPDDAEGYLRLVLALHDIEFSIVESDATRMVIRLDPTYLAAHRIGFYGARVTP